MDKQLPLLPPELVEALETYYADLQPDPVFAARLGNELRQHQNRLMKSKREPRFLWLNKWRIFMQTLRTQRALALLLILLALLVFSGVAYAVSRLSGFIPGSGFVSEPAKALQLESPVTTTQNGLTFSVVQAINNEENFFVQLVVSSDDPIKAEIDANCMAEILIPAGERISYKESYGDSTLGPAMTNNFLFDPLPEGIERFDINFDCRSLEDTPVLLGNVTMPIQLSIFPIADVIPAQDTSNEKLKATSQGVTMVLNNIAQSPEKTIFQVMLYTDQPGDPQEAIQPSDKSLVAGFLDRDWMVRLEDETGQQYAVRDITPEQEDMAYSFRLKTFETQAFDETKNLTLSLVPSTNDKLPLLLFGRSARINFDPGGESQVGQTWKLDELIQVGTFQLHLIRATRITSTGLLLEFEPVENVQAISLVGTSIEPEHMSQNGLMAGVDFAKFPAHAVSIEIDLIFYEAGGPWEIDWVLESQP